MADHPFYRSVDMAQAQRLVLFSIVGSVAVVLAARAVSPKGAKVQAKGSVLHAVVGGMFASLILVTTAEVAPKLSVAMSFLILTGTLLVYGQPALKAVQNAETSK